MTILSMALRSGYLVELFGGVSQRSEAWNSVSYLISDAREATIFEGVIHTSTELDIPVGFYGTALMGVLKGLHEDSERLIHPHRYDDPKDRGLVIASDETLKLWLRAMENNILEAIEFVGSMRMARVIYDGSHYEQTGP